MSICQNIYTYIYTHTFICSDCQRLFILSVMTEGWLMQFMIFRFGSAKDLFSRIKSNTVCRLRLTDRPLAYVGATGCIGRTRDLGQGSHNEFQIDGQQKDRLSSWPIAAMNKVSPLHAVHSRLQRGTRLECGSLGSFNFQLCASCWIAASAGCSLADFECSESY